MKPQSQPPGLDAAGLPSHRWAMPQQKPPNAPPKDRQAKLAEALRANLRRRKAALANLPGRKTKDA